MADEWKRLHRSLRRRRHHDLRPREKARRNSSVHLVAADLPATTDDSARRIVEPRSGAANLDLLPTREPEAAFDERVLENDGHVLQIFVDQRSTGEAERHADDFSRFAVYVHCSHSAWLAIILRPHSDLINIEYPSAEPNLK